MDLPRSCSAGTIKKMKKGLKKRKCPDEWKDCEPHQKVYPDPDKENKVNSVVCKKKRAKKPMDTDPNALSSPVQQRQVLPNRSTSAAAAMAKIASINAQSALQKTNVKSSDRRASLGDPKLSHPEGAAKDSKHCPQPLPAPQPTCKPVSSDMKPSEGPVSISQKNRDASVHLDPSRDSSSAVQNIRNCTTAISDAKISAEARLQMSNKMALEAERLHLEAQQESERASSAAQAICVKTDADDTIRRAEELQLTVMNLAKQVKEMQESKQHQEKEFQKHSARASAVMAELGKFKSFSESLKGQVEQLQQQLESYKADNAQVEKELEEQKQINRRLSQRLSGRFTRSEISEDDDLCAFLVEPEVNAISSKCQGKADPSDRSAGCYRPLDPQTPRSVSSATTQTHSTARSRFEDNDNDRVPLIKVPVVTPSKAHAAAIYNEPKNKVKQQEYAALLEQQIAEQKAMKKQQHAHDQAMTMDYFPFGRPGSGAPVRDENSNVVANVTFSRSKRIVPLDHPAGPLYAQRSCSQELLGSRKR